MLLRAPELFFTVLMLVRLLSAAEEDDPMMGSGDGLEFSDTGSSEMIVPATTDFIMEPFSTVFLAPESESPSDSARLSPDLTASRSSEMIFPATSDFMIEPFSTVFLAPESESPSDSARLSPDLTASMSPLVLITASESMSTEGATTSLASTESDDIFREMSTTVDVMSPDSTEPFLPPISTTQAGTFTSSSGPVTSSINNNFLQPFVTSELANLPRTTLHLLPTPSPSQLLVTTTTAAIEGSSPLLEVDTATTTMSASESSLDVLLSSTSSVVEFLMPTASDLGVETTPTATPTVNVVSSEMTVDVFPTVTLDESETTGFFPIATERTSALTMTPLATVQVTPTPSLPTTPTPSLPTTPTPLLPITPTPSLPTTPTPSLPTTPTPSLPTTPTPSLPTTPTPSLPATAVTSSDDFISFSAAMTTSPLISGQVMPSTGLPSSIATSSEVFIPTTTSGEADDFITPTTDDIFMFTSMPPVPTIVSLSSVTSFSTTSDFFMSVNSTSIPSTLTTASLPSATPAESFSITSTDTLLPEVTTLPASTDMLVASTSVSPVVISSVESFSPSFSLQTSFAPMSTVLTSAQATPTIIISSLPTTAVMTSDASPIVTSLLSSGQIPTSTGLPSSPVIFMLDSTSMSPEPSLTTASLPSRTPVESFSMTSAEASLVTLTPEMTTVSSSLLISTGGVVSSSVMTASPVVSGVQSLSSPLAPETSSVSLSPQPSSTPFSPETSSLSPSPEASSLPSITTVSPSLLIPSPSAASSSIPPPSIISSISLPLATSSTFPSLTTLLPPATSSLPSSSAMTSSIAPPTPESSPPVPSSAISTPSLIFTTSVLSTPSISTSSAAIATPLATPTPIACAPLPTSLPPIMTSDMVDIGLALTLQEHVSLLMLNSPERCSLEGGLVAVFVVGLNTQGRMKRQAFQDGYIADISVVGDLVSGSSTVTFFILNATTPQITPVVASVVVTAFTAANIHQIDTYPVVAPAVVSGGDMATSSTSTPLLVPLIAGVGGAILLLLLIIIFSICFVALYYRKKGRYDVQVMAAQAETGAQERGVELTRPPQPQDGPLHTALDSSMGRDGNQHTVLSNSWAAKMSEERPPSPRDQQVPAGLFERVAHYDTPPSIGPSPPIRGQHVRLRNSVAPSFLSNSNSSSKSLEGRGTPAVFIKGSRPSARAMEAERLREEALRLQEEQEEREIRRRRKATLERLLLQSREREQYGLAPPPSRRKRRGTVAPLPPGDPGGLPPPPHTNIQWTSQRQEVDADIETSSPLATPNNLVSPSPHPSSRPSTKRRLRRKNKVGPGNTDGYDSTDHRQRLPPSRQSKRVRGGRNQRGRPFTQQSLAGGGRVSRGVAYDAQRELAWLDTGGDGVQLMHFQPISSPALPTYPHPLPHPHQAIQVQPHLQPQAMLTQEKLPNISTLQSSSYTQRQLETYFKIHQEMEKLHLNQQPATPTIKPEATPTTKPKATSTSPNAEENTVAATKEENDEAVDGGNAEATPSGHTHQQQQVTPDTSIGPLDDSYSATLQELMQQVFTESGGLVRDREHGVVFTRDESIDKMLPRTSPPRAPTSSGRVSAIPYQQLYAPPPNMHYSYQPPYTPTPRQLLWAPTEPHPMAPPTTQTQQMLSPTQLTQLRHQQDYSNHGYHQWADQYQPPMRLPSHSQIRNQRDPFQ